MVISRRQFLGATLGAGAVGVAGVSYAWGYRAHGLGCDSDGGTNAAGSRHIPTD
jgi:hypothetical protein